MQIDTIKETSLDEAIDQYWESFLPVWNEIRCHLRALATDNFGISVEQFHILRHIRRGYTSVSELAEARQISRPAISQAVEALVEKDLISRRQDSADRRFVHLALTPTGENLLNGIFQQNRAWMKDKMAALDAEELIKITQAMELLKASFIAPSA